MIFSRMNRKGQIGKLISLFPIMLLIFIIMGIFVLLAASFSVKSIVSGEKGSPTFSEKIITQNDLMLMPIVMPFEKMVVDKATGQAQFEAFSLKMRVLDAVVFYSNNNYPEGATEGITIGGISRIFRLGLKSLMRDDKDSTALKSVTCLYLSKSSFANPSWKIDLLRNTIDSAAQSKSLSSYFIVRRGDKEPDDSSVSDSKFYRGVIRDFSFYGSDDKPVYIDYYYGRCL